MLQTPGLVAPRADDGVPGLLVRAKAGRVMSVSLSDRVVGLSRRIARIIWRGLGGGGSGLAPSAAEAVEHQATNRRQASGPRRPSPWTTPALAMSSSTRSSGTKSARKAALGLGALDHRTDSS